MVSFSGDKEAETIECFNTAQDDLLNIGNT